MTGLRIENSRFVDNRALSTSAMPTSGMGGAMYITTDIGADSKATALNVTGCFFDGNSAPVHEASTYVTGGNDIRLLRVRSWEVKNTTFTDWQFNTYANSLSAALDCRLGSCHPGEGAPRTPSAASLSSIVHIRVGGALCHASGWFPSRRLPCGARLDHVHPVQRARA